jgi:hypothetical protein
MTHTSEKNFRFRNGKKLLSTTNNYDERLIIVLKENYEKNSAQTMNALGLS